MRRGVNAPCATAHHRHTDVGELIRQLARRLDAVMRGLPRADHRHGVFIFYGQFPFDVKHERRVVNLPERFGIRIVTLDQDVAAKIRDAFQFTGQVG